MLFEINAFNWWIAAGRSHVSQISAALMGHVTVLVWHGDLLASLNSTVSKYSRPFIPGKGEKLQEYQFLKAVSKRIECFCV